MIAAKTKLINELYETTDTDVHVLNDPDVAYLVVHHDEVIGAHLIPGLSVDTSQIDDGLDVRIGLAAGTIVKKPVHLCFGMMPEEGIQRIIMHVDIEEDAKIVVKAHCTFPFAVDVKHIMDATIKIGKNAEYSYFERHIHSPKGGVKVYPTAAITLDEGAKFKTEFELLKGRVGEIYIDYETTCHKNSVMEMISRVNGTGEDIINIKETSHLVGEGARGVLTSRIAVRDNARAEVYNTLTAHAPFTRGHVDCHEIVQGNGTARAIPIVDVADPHAHVTHEAAIGSVDNKQLETLMARGLTEDEAVELIIEGLLS